MMKQFQPDVPKLLLAEKPPDVQWLYEQQSIQRQQNEYLAQQNETILTRLAENNERQDVHAKSDETIQAALSVQVQALKVRMDAYDVLVSRITNPKWVTGAIVFGSVALLGPIVVTALVTHYVEKWFR